MNLKPSRYRLLIIVFSHMAAMVAVWLSSLSIITSLLFSMVIIGLAFWTYRQYCCLKQTHSLTSIRLLDDQWRVCLGSSHDKQWVRAWPEGDIVVTSLLISFKLKVEGSKRSCYLVLFPDSAEATELHAFRLRLLLEGPSLFSRQRENSPVSK